MPMVFSKQSLQAMGFTFLITHIRGPGSLWKRLQKGDTMKDMGCSLSIWRFLKRRILNLFALSTEQTKDQLRTPLSRGVSFVWDLQLQHSNSNAGFHRHWCLLFKMSSQSSVYYCNEVRWKQWLVSSYLWSDTLWKWVKVELLYLCTCCGPWYNRK